MIAWALAWLAMLVVSVANGALRDFSYGRQMSELSAHQLSTLTGILLLGIVIRFYLRRRPPSSDHQAMTVGLGWMLLTVAFEFLFFHYVGEHSWAALLANYRIDQGRLWVLILLWIALAPLLFHRLRKRA